MYKKQFDRLDEIIDKTIDSIENSIGEIKGISDFARSEYMALEVEFLKLKIEATDLIDRVESLEKQYKTSRIRLLTVNKHLDDCTEEQMHDIQNVTDQLRLQLAVEKEREMNLLKRRIELERHLKSVRETSEKADKLNRDFDVAYSVLSGDLKQTTEKIDESQNKEIWGLKVIQAQELERKRIARDMHDGPAQSLSNLVIKAELCLKLLDKDIDRTKLELQNLKGNIRSTIDETRRMIYNLRPISIDECGLIPTLERLIEKIREASDLYIEFIVKETKAYDASTLDTVINITLYRITQEALNNIINYAEASSVRVELTYEADAVELLIIDNGVGFEIKELKFNLDDNKGYGIPMMRERANLLNGEMTIISEINKGTSIHISVPLTERK